MASDACLWEQVAMGMQEFAVDHDREKPEAVTTAWKRRQALRSRKMLEEHCKAVQSKADATSRCAKEQRCLPPPPPPPRSSAPKGQNLKAPPKGQNLNVWVHKKWTDTSDPHQVAMRQLKDKKNRREAYRKARRAA